MTRRGFLQVAASAPITLPEFRPRSMLCVPMVSKDTLLGVIQVINKVLLPS
jgi:hypothetical protein